MRGALGFRTVARAPAPALEAGLQVQRHRIVHLGSHPYAAQKTAQGVALPRPNHILMEDVAHRARPVGKNHRMGFVRFALLRIG